jgi:cephalosporin-C deacetylase-like acetyl esterase
MNGMKDAAGTEPGVKKNQWTLKKSFAMRTSLLSVLLLIIIEVTFAQPRQEYVKVIVAPDHADWTYNLGENVDFRIQVMKNGNPVENTDILYEIKEEKMETRKSDKITLKNGIGTIKGGTMDKPGFLRCWVTVNIEGNEYKGYATAGFEPENIKPTTELPNDFSAFWDQAKAELAKVPVEAEVTLLPKRCTEKVNVYHVGINSIDGSHIYGILAVPKQSGNYPAILRVPGAGIRPYSGNIWLAEKGFIAFQIGIHGIPVNLPEQVYTDLRYGALNNYWSVNLDDKDEYYYKRVYLGCVRAVDFIFSHPQFDDLNIGVIGGSQGGALSIITAGLDARIRYLGAFYPALCDLTGYLHERAGGWPHLFRNEFTNKKDKVKTSQYYDVVNFARFVNVPGMYSWGYNDNVCPPTSFYSAYNVIEAEKQVFLVPETAHWTYPEQRDKVTNWLLDKINNE